MYSHFQAAAAFTSRTPQGTSSPSGPIVRRMHLRITTDPDDFDIALIHQFLSQESTWARGISRELVLRSIRNSLCFGGFLDDSQVAFARVVTDYSTFANLVDV